MGIAEMRKNVDTMIVVPNERLLAVVGKGIPFQDALKKADEVLLHATQGISSLISVTGLVNVDFADVRTVMQSGGSALMGTGIGRGENRAMEAAQQAITSPLLDNVCISGATGVLVNITGGADLTLGEVHQINEIIHDAVGDDAEIIFGAVHEPAMQGEIRVTVIATGLRPRRLQRLAVRRAQEAHRSTAASQTPVIPFPNQRPLRATVPAPRPAANEVPRRSPMPQPGAAPQSPQEKVSGSQRHGDPDVHSETDGLKLAHAAHGDHGGRRRACRVGTLRGSADALARPPHPIDTAVAASRPLPATRIRSRLCVDTLGRGESLGSSLLAPRRMIAATHCRALHGRERARRAPHSARECRSRPVRLGRLGASRGRLPARDRPVAARPSHRRHVDEQRGAAPVDDRHASSSAAASTTICIEALDASATNDLPTGARAELAWSLADVYEYRVDMSRDLQHGDAFHVVVRALGRRRMAARGSAT